MRFSRPNLPKLDLDLADFSGGGSCPSQFNGVTQEGRPIYARYRNGWLTIDLEEPEKTLLEARIGDSYDGDILLEQVCDLAGITIRGATPVLTREALSHDGRAKDWSGRTTYWSFHLNYTVDAGRAFLSALGDKLPGTFVAWESFLGEDEKPMRRYIVKKLPDTGDWGGIYYIGVDRSDDVVLHHLSGHFDRFFDRSQLIDFRMPTDPRSREFDRYNSEFASKQCKREVHIPQTFWGRFEGEIKTESASEQKLLSEIELLVARHFNNRYKSVDIDSGEVVNHFEAAGWYSRDLVEWCDFEKMRFLSATTEKSAPNRPIGDLPDA